MSDTKAGKGDRLAEAMAQAMEAVEAREAEARSDEPDIEEETDDAAEDGEVEVEVEGSDEGEDAPPPKESPAAAKPAPAKAKDAGEAVTEALLKAKNELEDLLERSKADAAKIKNKWLRAAADLENYKKRARRERDDIVKFGSERIIKDMLPVLDDMDRTVEVMEASEEARRLGLKLLTVGDDDDGED